MVLLDDLLPAYEFNEVHSVRIAAPPGAVLEAIERATLGEMPLVRALFAVRSLPTRLAGRRGLPADGSESLYEQMLGLGFVRLAEEPGREVVAGAIGQMWRVRGGFVPALRDARGFVAFGEPGYAKAAVSFSAEPRAGGGTELRTETRVATIDPASRRAFGRYWRLIRPGSGAIRRSWLGAAKRRAEQGGPGGQGDGSGPPKRGKRVGDGVLRNAQGLLAAVFAGAGAAKVAVPKDDLRTPMPWVDDFSQSAVRLIGVLELLGAAGVVLPDAADLLPALTPLAAAGLGTVMVVGFATHVRRGEFVRSAPNVVLFALAALVAHGRYPSSWGG